MLVLRNFLAHVTLIVCSALILATPKSAFAQDPCELDDPPPPPECWSVEVTPHGGVEPTRTANTGPYTVTFTVDNTGNPDTYVMECSSSANVTCTNVTPGSVASFATVTVTYSVGAAGPGTLWLCASGTFASDCGWYSIPINTFSVAVTPDGGPSGTTPTRVPNTGGYTATFTVQNTGTSTDSWVLTCTSSPNVTCGTIGPSNVNLAQSASQVVTVSYSVGAASGTLTLNATSAQSNNTGFYTVPVSQPAGSPIVDVTPYNFDKQDYSRCAMACFATVYAQSTVPYFSLNAPRSVTLVYNSDRVNPRPIVHVDVTPDLSTGTPTEYQLEIWRNGARLRFVNNDTILRFSYPGNVKVRLGAQLDADANGIGATGVYPIDIVVSALYPGPVATSIPSRLVVVNELNSPVAAGWTLGGIQRLYLQGDGSALITEGDGSAVYFWNVGGTFVPPAGEFSTLSGTGGWTRTGPDGSQAVFDATGRMTQLRDRFGNATTILYDATNRVAKIIDPAAVADTLTYDPNGLATVAELFSGGRTTNVTVASTRRLTAITDPDGAGTRFSTDAAHLLWKVFDRRGDSTKFGYHSSRKATFITYAPVPVVLSNGVHTVESPTESRYPWQHVGVPYTTTGSTPAAPPLADTVRSRIVDGRGFSTYFSVNRSGSPLAITDAQGAVDSIRYDQRGLPVRGRYATTGVDTMAYNAQGLPAFVRTAGQSAVNIRYGAFAQPDSIWGDGRPTTRHYLGLSGLIDMTVRAGQDTSRYTYDGRGRVLTTRDPQGHLLVKHFYEGPNGNLSKDSLPGNRITTYLHDAFGRDTAVQAPESPLRRTHYDLINRVIEVFDGVHPNPTRTAYDSIFVRSVTDPKGQVYGLTYNALGWLMSRTDPAGRADQYAYDKNGNLKRWLNRRADSLKYTYDGVNRLTNKTGNNTAAECWSSADRRVVTGTSPVSTETAYLSVAGVPDSVKTLIAGQTYWRRYRYTTAVLLDSVDFAGSAVSLRARKYLYDASFRALTQIRLGGVATNIARNKDLQDTSITFPAGDRVRKLFYPLHNATQISTSAPYNNTIARSIGFDSLGRIREQVEGDGSIGHRYAYDGLGRLIGDTSILNAAPQQTCDGDPPPIVDENGNSCVTQGGWQATGWSIFAYDSAGNRRDNGGQYTTGNRITAFAGCSYTTDNDGNVTSRTCGTETVIFAWSAEGRLTSFTVNGTTTTLSYDAVGRVAKKVIAGGSGSHFIWDGQNLLAELDLNGTTVLAEYSYYPGLDNLHAVVVGGQQYNAHIDGLGNTIALTGSDQGVKRAYSYDAWGQLSGGTDFAGFGSKDRARFKGALWLGQELDVYYMRARWYEPKTGRFLSEDPIGLDGGINSYIYAGDDPVNARDPTGLECYAVYEKVVVTYRGDIIYEYWAFDGWECTGNVSSGNRGGNTRGTVGSGGSGGPPGGCHTAHIDNPNAPHCVLRAPNASEKARLWRIYKGLISDRDRFCQQFAIPLRNLVAAGHVWMYDTHYPLGPGYSLRGDATDFEIHLYSENGWFWSRTVVHEVAHVMPAPLTQFQHSPDAGFDWDGRCDVL